MEVVESPSPAKQTISIADGNPMLNSKDNADDKIEFVCKQETKFFMGDHDKTLAHLRKMNMANALDNPVADGVNFTVYGANGVYAPQYKKSEQPTLTFGGSTGTSNLSKPVFLKDASGKPKKKPKPPKKADKNEKSANAKEIQTYVEDGIEK